MSPPKNTPPELPQTPRQRLAAMIVVFRQVPRTFRVLWQAAPGLALLLASLVVVQALIPAGIAWVAKLIIDGVAHAARTGDLEARAQVLRYVALELGLVIGQMAFGRAAALVRERIGQRLKRLLARQVLDKALALEVRHFEDSALYDKMQNARREADVRPLHLVTEAFAIAQGMITLASYAVLLVSLAPWSLIVLVAASIPSFIAEVRFAARGYRVLSWRAPDHRRLNYLEWILTRDGTVKEVKLFQLGPLVLGRYFELFDKVIEEDRRLAWSKAMWGTVLGLVSVGAFYACYAWVADTAAAGALTLGDMALYLTVFRQGQNSFAGILTAIGSIYEDALFMSNLFSYLDTESTGERARVFPPRTLRRRSLETPTGTGGTGGHDLELRHVSFTYPGTSSVVLDDINLHVKPGQRLALVGENGAGKSTLVKLLLRMYEPTAGEILYGGVDIRDLDVRDLRSRFSAVFQDFVRYQLRVKENVGIGDVAHLDDRGRIERAAEKGGAIAVVEKLPERWETMLGGWFEDGQELSGGQWQKLALARAFMREEAEVLILDEPSAAIDARAEAELFERLRTLAADRIAFLISHRFSTVRMADQIAVLEGGRVVELGSHDELLAQGGHYAQLFLLQAKGYR
jgi:ATP-binding cassette, subfamily B, bacterial